MQTWRGGYLGRMSRVGDLTYARAARSRAQAALNVRRLSLDEVRGLSGKQIRKEIAVADEADTGIHDTIKRLVAEEHAIWESGSASDTDRARLRELNESLDQCWDLLRQREALREADADPAQAKARSVDDVERYLQ